jgi:hypothetical protein
MVMRSDNVLNASTSQIADTRGDAEILAVDISRTRPELARK